MGRAVTLTVALLSPGAMGAAVGARLVESGARVLTSLDGRGGASRERAAAAGLVDAPVDQLVAADLLLSIVPPADAEDLARRLAPALTAAPRKPIYVDCNALSPATKRAVGAIVAAAGAPFVDATILGGPPRPGSRGPAVYVCGKHVAAVRPLATLGLDLHEMAGPSGAAAALKMAYAGINKGAIGLAAAMILAAGRAGVGDALREAGPSRIAGLAAAMPDMYPKAWRWAPEMREIAAFAEDEATAMIFEGLARLYERLADDTAARAVLDDFLQS